MTMNVYYNLLCVVFINSLGLVIGSFLECSDDTDCVADTAYCDYSSICQCPSGQVFNVDGTECVDLSLGYGSSCTDDNQCSWLLGKYVCSNGACICEDGWWYYKGRCRRAAGLGESCNATENCYNGYDILAMVCSDGICTCSSDYYLRGNYDCRPKAEEEGDYCSLDSDCANLGSNYVCKVAACVLSSSNEESTTVAATTVVTTTIAPDTSTLTNTDTTTSTTAFTGSDTTTPTNTDTIIFTNTDVTTPIIIDTTIPKNTLPTIDTTTSTSTDTTTSIDINTTTMSSGNILLSDLILDSTQRISQAEEQLEFLSITERAITNITCENTTDCTSSTENSVCYSLTGTCVCKRGYFYSTKTGLCTPELGVYSNCTSDTDCGITASRCLNGTCYCRKTYFTLPGSSACQKPMTNDNLWCNSMERCYVMGTNVSCTNNKCTCASGATLDDDYICRVSENATNTCGCSSDSDCSDLPNSVCSDGDCVCPTNYRYDNSSCLPNLGATCDGASALCTINHASCSSANLCQCDTNYFASENATTCYQETEGLGASCELDLQCLRSVNNSACINDVCTCDDSYKNINGSCYLKKSIGDSCTNVLECRVTLGENVYCRKGICQCPANMIGTNDGLDCTTSGSYKPHFSFYSIIILLLTFSTLCVL